MVIVSTKPIGAFPGIPAPDETWKLREDWPAEGERVELCWASRKEEPARYGYGEGWLVQRDADGMSNWKNLRGENLLFNPDFWRRSRIVMIDRATEAVLRKLKSINNQSMNVNPPIVPRHISTLTKR